MDTRELAGCGRSVVDAANALPRASADASCNPLAESDAGEPPHAATVRPGTKRRRRGIVYFRPVQPRDRAVVQHLHEQWFPVEYKSEFYDGLCRERLMPGTGEPLHCCVACYREIEDGGSNETDEECAARLVGEWRHDCFYWESDSSDREDNECLVEELRNDTLQARGSSEESAGVCVLENKEVGPTEVIASPEDDYLESGGSNSSLRHRAERNRMKKFYDNGYLFESDDKEGKASESENCEPTNSDQEGRSGCIKRRRDHTQCLNNAGERIIGCLVGSFLPSSMMSAQARGNENNPPVRNRSSENSKARLDEKSDRDLLVPDPERYSRAFYIMTLGTTSEFRRTGLGTLLVNRVVEMIRSRPECGALYLHVITYNLGAIRLYERLGFLRVKEIEDYYTINGVNYNCYLYARYFHGNLGHRSIYDVLVGYAQSVWNYLIPWRT